MCIRKPLRRDKDIREKCRIMHVLCIKNDKFGNYIAVSLPHSTTRSAVKNLRSTAFTFSFKLISLLYSRINKYLCVKYAKNVRRYILNMRHHLYNVKNRASEKVKPHLNRLVVEWLRHRTKSMAGTICIIVSKYPLEHKNPNYGAHSILFLVRQLPPYRSAKCSDHGC